MKSKNEKLYKVLMLLGIAIFFLTATKCTAQVRRENNYEWNTKNKVVTISPVNALDFSAFDKDADSLHTQLVIKSDSVGKNIFSFYLVAKYPTYVKIPKTPTSIRIDFDNGKTAYFVAESYNKLYNSVKYNIDPDNLGLIGGCNIKHVELENLQSDIVSNKDYFIKFCKTVLE